MNYPTRVLATRVRVAKFSSNVFATTNNYIAQSYARYLESKGQASL